MLLALVSVRLRLADPTPVFAVAGLLAALMLGMVRAFKADALAAAADLGAGGRAPLAQPAVLAVECESCAGVASGFALLFLVFPFLFQRNLAQRVPWAVAALSPPLHFLLIYRGVLYANPDFAYKGLIPAAGVAVPGRVGSAGADGAEGKSDAEHAVRAVRGVSLFFITFIFPIHMNGTGSRSGGRWKGRRWCGCSGVPHRGCG